MSKRILISLGGNALGTLYDDLMESVKIISKPIAKLVENGNEVVICHGNGPQVGYIKKNIDLGAMADGTESLPLSECVAMSQSFIGYQLSNAIENELKNYGINKKVPTIVTRVVVDENDKSFQNPTKPIGAFYSKEKSLELEKAGKVMVEDSGRGYREVVASPYPTRIIETDAINESLKTSPVVIAGGGGGIPTIEKDGNLVAIDAVIDKDRTSVMLAHDTNCDSLVILTGVEKVAINFNKPNQEDLARLTVADAKKYMEEGQFPAGSMQPKVESAIAFVESGENRETLITSLEKLVEGMNGETGTLIVK